MLNFLLSTIRLFLGYPRIILIGFWWFSPIATAEQCTMDDGPVSCKVCSQSYSSNSIHTLPRADAELKPASSNVGGYQWTKLRTNGSVPSDLSSVVNIDLELPEFNMDIMGEFPLGSPERYLQSLMMYTIFFIVLGALCLLGSIAFCVMRGFFDGCGGRLPTPRNAIGLGYIKDPKTDIYKYPSNARRITQFAVAFFLLFLFIWICVGLDYNAKTKDSLKTLVHAPNTLTNQVQSAVKSTENFVDQLLINVLPNSIKQFNATISNAVDLKVTVERIDCVINESEHLQSSKNLEDIISDAIFSARNLTVALAKIPVELDVMEMNIDQVQLNIKTAQNIVNSFALIRSSVNSNLTELENSIDTLFEFNNKLFNSTNGIPAITHDIESLDDWPSTQETSNARALLSVLNPDSAHKADTLAALVSLRDSYSNLPNYKKLADRMTNFNMLLDEGNSTGVVTNVSNSIAQAKISIQQVSGLTNQANTTLKNALLLAKQNFSFDTMQTIILEAEQTLQSIPPLNSEAYGVLSFTGVSTILTCTTYLIATVNKVNTSLWILPQEFGTINNIAYNINESLSGTLDTIEQTSNQFDNYDNIVTNLDLKNLLQNLKQMETDVNSNTNTSTVNSLIEDADQAEKQILNIDFSIESDIHQLETTVNTVRFETSVIEELETAQDYLEYPLIDALNIAIFQLQQGTNPDADLRVYLSDIHERKPDAAVTRNRLDIITTDTDASRNATVLDGLVNESRTSFESVDLDNFKTQVDIMMDATKLINISDKRREVLDLNNTLYQLEKDLNETSENITSVEEAFSNVTKHRAQLEEAKLFLKNIIDMIFKDMPVNLQELNRTSESNFSMKILKMTSIIDQWVESFINVSTNLTNRTTKYRDLIDDVLGDTIRQHGSMNYLAYLMNTLVLGRPDRVVVHGSGEYRFDTNTLGQPYPNGGHCYTSNCFLETVEYYFSEKLILLSNGVVPLELNWEQLHSLAYLFPFAVLAIGIATLICSFIKTCEFRIIHRGIIGMSCCIMMQMPFIFITIGILFPFVLGLGDVCYGIENVAFNTLFLSGNNICQLGLNGTGTNTNCQLILENKTLSVNLEIVFLGIFGGQCHNDPVDPFFKALGAHLHQVAQSTVDEVINSVEGIEMRKQLKDVFRDMGNSTGYKMVELMDQVSEKLDCQSLNTGYMNIKNPFCCDVVTSIYWAICAWVYIGFAYLCCGCPSTVFAYKRFPHSLWDENVAKLQSCEDQLQAAETEEVSISRQGLDEIETNDKHDYPGTLETGSEVELGLINDDQSPMNTTMDNSPKHHVQ